MKGTKKHAPVTLHDHFVDALMNKQTAECVSPEMQYKKWRQHLHCISSVALEWLKALCNEIHLSVELVNALMFACCQ